MVSCSACSEQYGVTKDVTFHKFPANEERRKQWLNALQRGTWTPGKRSMLCSKHFSPDKFVYKVLGNKIIRYLMRDTVPTIFDKTGKTNDPPQQLGAGKRSHSVVDTKISTDSVDTNWMLGEPVADIALNDAIVDLPENLDLESLSPTSVVLDTSPKLAVTPAVAGSSTNTCSQRVRSSQNRGAKRAHGAAEISNNVASVSKRPRQVYPGDFNQLNYNNGTEVSKSWTVLHNYIKKMRMKMKVLQQRNRRLEKRVTDLKSVVKFLKHRIVTTDSAYIKLCGHSGLPQITEPHQKEDPHRKISNPLADHDYTSADCLCM